MQYKQDIKELETILLLSKSLFKDLHTESKQVPYVTMMGLFASLIEHSSSFLILMQNNLFHSTQSIARTVFEIHVDILNLNNDGNYSNYLWAEYYDREKELKKPRSQRIKLKDKRDHCFKLYNKYSKFEVLTPHQKFKLADKKPDYDSIYSPLSAHTHSGIFTLINRVMEEGKENKITQKLLFKSKPSNYEFLSISLICNCLLDTCEIVASGHDSEYFDFVNKVRTFLINRTS